MKIYIEYDLANESGKGKFLARLTKEWSRTGEVKYSSKPNGCDARLCLTRFRTKSKLPTVLRIDGAHNEAAKGKKKRRVEASLRWKNKETGNSIKGSKAVIYQSDYCRKMGHAIFGAKAKREYVIFNGADPAEFKQREVGTKNVIMMAYWKNRPHKRLAEMVAVARQYTEIDPEARFYVLGETECPPIAPKNLTYCGHLNRDQIAEHLSKAACMLNISYADWCPNAVVEALVAGVPVICTKGHGVSEIVNQSGIVLDIDDIPPANPKNFKRATNPQIKDFAPVYGAIKEILEGGKVFPVPEHLHISRIAKQYAEVFRAVVK